jgi:putative endonuclease
MYEHKTNAIRGFTANYDVKMLVYYEETPSIEAAITREKQLKNWKRDWKIALIEKLNPEWNDLYLDIIDSGSRPE